MISLEFSGTGFMEMSSLMKICNLLLIILALLLVTPGLALLAQPNAQSQSAGTQVATSDKTGKEAVCDGALEIIPSGQVSFARKRYIAKVKTKPSKARTQSHRSM